MQQASYLIRQLFVAGYIWLLYCLEMIGFARLAAPRTIERDRGLAEIEQEQISESSLNFEIVSTFYFKNLKYNNIIII